MILPLLVLLTFGIIEFGVAFNASSSVSQASRAGGRTAAIFSTDPQLEFNAGSGRGDRARRQPQQHHGPTDHLREQVRRRRRPVHEPRSRRARFPSFIRARREARSGPSTPRPGPASFLRRPTTGRSRSATTAARPRASRTAPTTASSCGCRYTTTFSCPGCSASSSATRHRRRSPRTPSSNSSRYRLVHAHENCASARLRRTRRRARLACDHAGSPPRRDGLRCRRRVLASHEEPRTTRRRRRRARGRGDVPRRSRPSPTLRRRASRPTTVTPSARSTR